VDSSNVPLGAAVYGESVGGYALDAATTSANLVEGFLQRPTV
jgi:hypothetical protein